MPALERSSLVPLAAAAVLAVATGFSADRVLVEMRANRPYDVLWIPRGEALRLASPSIRLSFADCYWLSTVQYVGDAQAQRRGLEKLYPLVDFVTDLDPQHGYAYQTAGIVLSAEGRLDESERILRKGMEKGPRWWSYPFYIAFNHFFYLGDYAGAARWAEIAARTPGASPNISHLAMALDVKSGSPESALRFLEEMRASARDDATTAALEEQYKLAVLQKDFRALDGAVERFRTSQGRSPARLDELVAAGILPSIPPSDPFGGRYEIRDGVVHATGRDQRFAPAEGGRLAGRGEPPPMLRRPSGPQPPPALRDGWSPPRFGP